MSVLSDLEAKLAIDEAKVATFFSTTLPNIEAKLAADLQGVAQVFDNVLQWMGAHGQEIAGDVTTALTIAAAVGVGVPAPVLLADQALNTAVSIVNSAVAAQQQAAAGNATPLAQAIAGGGAGYAALKTAQAQTAIALSSVAIPAPTAASIAATPAPAAS